MAFKNIIGNLKVKSFLASSIYNKNILHSYMFYGPSGVGKLLFAEEFAKMLLCNESDLKKVPCNICDSCLKFNSENHPDFIKINPADGKTIKIEQIRFLTEKILEKPIISNRKVYIIDDSDCMTKEAQNCLLKTLEEPPSYATIILIVANESKLLNTIKSRCMKISFGALSDDEISEYFLKQNISLDKNILKVCNGSIGKAYTLQNEIIPYDEINNIINNLIDGNMIDVFNTSDVLYNSKDNINDILEYINIIFLDKLMSNNNIAYANCIKVIEKAKRKLSLNNNYDMTIDFLLLNIAEELKK